LRIMLFRPEERRPELTIGAGVRRKYEVRQPPLVTQKAFARREPGKCHQDHLWSRKLDRASL
jgi:hypothetical protein